MMRLPRTTYILAACLILSACGSDGDSNPSGSGSGGANTATVNLTVSDTPSSTLTVLAFQVQITAATLEPGSVSLLPRPVTVDLAQLVTDTGFLASTVIDSGTYSSLAITLANPQVTILNNSGAALTLPEGSCAAGATCTFAPTLDNATVTISNGVLPLTITASSSTGLNLDLSIPDLLQSDLSVSTANGSSVNLSLLSGASTSVSGTLIADVLGTVTGITGNQVNITTALGNALVLTSTDGSTYQFPTSVCPDSSLDCLAVGQVVTADLSVQTSGELQIDSLSYLGASGSQWVKVLVLGPVIAGSSPAVPVLVQTQINTGDLNAGLVANVSLPAAAVYAIGSTSYPAVASATFAGASDLLPGQELIVGVGGNLLTGSSPSFDAGSLYLEASQLIGVVGSVSSSEDTLQLLGLSGLFAYQRPVIQGVTVQVGTATQFVGFSDNSLSELAVGQFVASKGPLFNTTSGGGSPSLAAVQVSARSTGN